MDWEAVCTAIEEARGGALGGARAWPIGGGCINSAFRLDGPEVSYFVKVNDRSFLDMFEAEAAGLSLLAQPGGPRVPEVVAVGEAGAQAFLALEYVQLRSARAEDFRRLGERLAALHRVTAPRHGWDRDNTIGTTPQMNAWCEDWVEFFRERRLRVQLDLAGRNGHPELSRQAEPLLAALASFFEGYRPTPSLLHGDLWSGNVAFDAAGEPVIFDPACYFGDRESDIAMTELFGGFGEGFYRVYDASYPLDSGYAVRKQLYQLYHVLNHLNLFGGGYRGQAERLIQRLCAEL